MWVVKAGWGWRRHFLILYLNSYCHYQNQKVAWKTSQTMKDLFWLLSGCVTRQSLDIYALASYVRLLRHIIVFIWRIFRTISSFSSLEAVQLALSIEVKISYRYVAGLASWSWQRGEQTMYISHSVMFDIHTRKHRCRPSPGFVMFVFHLDHIFTVSAPLSPPVIRLTTCCPPPACQHKYYIYFIVGSTQHPSNLSKSSPFLIPPLYRFFTVFNFRYFYDPSN